MPVKFSRDLKHRQDGFGAEQNIQEYEDSFRMARDAVAENDNSDDRMVSVLYYDLVTDFYEYGWGGSFHFARVSREKVSRHRLYATNAIWRGYLALSPGWSLPTWAAASAAR